MPHVPRQTGKTSSLLAVMQHLDTGCDYRSIYVNVEAAQAVREDAAAVCATCWASSVAVASRADAALAGEVEHALDGQHGALADGLVDVNLLVVGAQHLL